ASEAYYPHHPPVRRDPVSDLCHSFFETSRVPRAAPLGHAALRAEWPQSNTFRFLRRGRRARAGFSLASADWTLRHRQDPGWILRLIGQQPLRRGESLDQLHPGAVVLFLSPVLLLGAPASAAGTADRLRPSTNFDLWPAKCS